MKKSHLITVFVSFCLLLSLAACNQFSDPQDILVKIDKANTKEALLQVNEKTAYSDIFYRADGTSETSFRYLDKDMYLFQYKNNEMGILLVDKNKDITVHSEQGKEHIHIKPVFIGDKAYEELMQYYPVTQFLYEPNEKVTSTKEENGKLIIDAEITNSTDVATYAQNHGYTPDQVEKATLQYVVNSDNYIINSLVSYINMKDGSRTKVSEFTMIENYNDYMPKEDINADTSALQQRTITVIENPGTDQEKTHKASVPVGYKARIILSSEYEQKFYSDPALTKESQENTDLTKDFTLYIKKAQ